MLAVLKENPTANEIIVKDIEIPIKKPSNLIIKVEAVGICGSDLHAYHWTPDYQKRLQGCLPVVLGHEFIGTVKEVGKAIDSFQEGDRVIAMPGINCGNCYCCLNGEDGICINRVTMAVNFDGAMAEYISVPANNCIKVSNNFPAKLGALIEPITVAYNAILKAGNLLGKDVVVFGPGPIGYFISLFAYFSGARNLVVIGLPQDYERFKIFKNNIPNIKIIENLNMEKKNNYLKNGVDVIFEVTGSKKVLQIGLELIRKKGRIITLGLVPDEVSINLNLITRGELNITGSHGASKSVWQEVIKYIQYLQPEEIVKFKECITHEYPLNEAKKAFKIMEEGTGMKVLLIP